MKFNLKSIMNAAWRLVRKLGISIAEGLRIAWSNAKATATAKENARVTEETHTWSGWKAMGHEVLHGAEALYKVIIIDPSTKTGKRTIAYFGLHQTQEV